MGERQRQEHIVRFWQAVEYFSPQKAPRLDPRARVFPVQPGRPLPWEAPEQLPNPRKGYVWQYTLHCGVFPIARVRDTLAEIFQDSGCVNLDSRVSGDSALLAFTVNADGLLLKESVVVSACAWAVGRSRSPGPDTRSWLTGFDAEAEDCAQKLLDLGDGKLTVRGGGLPGATSLLASAGTLVLDAALGGAVTGVGTLVRGVVGQAVGGVLGSAASAAAGTATESVAQGAADALRRTVGGTDDDLDQDGDVRLPRAVGSRPLTVADIAAFTAWLADRLGVTSDLNPDAARVSCFQVRERNRDEPPTQDFLNSFVADDLAEVADALAAGDCGRAATLFLTENADLPVDQRTDVRADPTKVLGGVDPGHVPGGRWPSDTTRPLALSQQFAVNTLLAQLGGSTGLFAVNGPPGTGKTTMLRDVVAALVTERACRLAEFADPSAAFGKPHTWTVDGRPRTVRELKPALTGYEIVVASANNGAVENITTEIPARAAVDEQWRAEAAYLPEQASLLLGEVPAWGAVAARLGRRSHRQEFVDRFWWASAAKGAAGTGLRGLLGDTSQWLSPRQWSEAVARFRACQGEVDRLRAERAAAAETLRELTVARERLAEYQEQASAHQRRLPGLELEALAVGDRHDAAVRLAESCGSRVAEHRRERPGLAANVGTAGRARRRWRSEAFPLVQQHDAARQAVAEQAASLARLHAAIEAAQRWNRAIETQAELVAALADAVAAYSARWPGRVPDPAAFQPGRDPETEDERERSAPWADEEFTAARTRLFLEALRLHRAFLLANAVTMRRNLDAAMEIVARGAPGDLDSAAIRAAWQSVFLVVPVVSTTFASFHRMFAGLGREALGWVFIDEAGQAAPQLAIGAIWRSKRAVVVGDPCQLEPVVVLPYSAQQRLRAHFDVASLWCPTGSSVQHVADRLNVWGTTLPTPESVDGAGIWVGAPLRVHRRCDDPMFTISNEVAYGGLMVDGVRGQRRTPFAAASRSVWWDVRGGEGDGVWVPQEGAALRRAVQRLTERGLTSDQLFVLSPFREVAAGAGRELRDLLPSGRVGTVHTAQGKESDVVILVLGTRPRSVGSRDWAASKPNLLNVAVSRARRRLIVIGDLESWRQHRYFSVLARELASAVSTAESSVS